MEWGAAGLALSALDLGAAGASAKGMQSVARGLGGLALLGGMTMSGIGLGESIRSGNDLGIIESSAGLGLGLAGAGIGIASRQHSAPEGRGDAAAAGAENAPAGGTIRYIENNGIRTEVAPDVRRDIQQIDMTPDDFQQSMDMEIEDIQKKVKQSLWLSKQFESYNDLTDHEKGEFLQAIHSKSAHFGAIRNINYFNHDQYTDYVRSMQPKTKEQQVLQDLKFYVNPPETMLRSAMKLE
jgi:hypothetical protein